ncbi:hypothetical protein [Bosea lathyri]|jgi:hypothetical protein|uniref:Uncharacterized protein n=1 Tax=Bosea lathyri TaxID=1036778 RepID=A0A1H5S650_9HYPH|nr:hypothetical protein [Bosea lathyri]SEF45358.1 hypothetical protein SAMN04488115_101135 [Bosea lathyri]
MFDLFRVRQARREAYAALEPFVNRTTLEGNVPHAGDWLQPQIIGFLATFVTLIAQRRCGALRTHALASVQSNVLNTLTGIGPELIGEEICLLSSRRDPAFAAGSFGALAFLEALGSTASAAADASETPDQGADLDSRRRSTLDELWEEHVESGMRRARAVG